MDKNLVCLRCAKNFTVAYELRRRKYCSAECCQKTHKVKELSNIKRKKIMKYTPEELARSLRMKS